jgi:hypothetical protein
MKKIVITGTALALLALACGEEPVTPEEGYRLLPTSPVQVLKNVERAFNHRDVNLLKAMLSENFVFYFDPDDVGQNPPGNEYIIPESWSYIEFWMALKRMFTGAHSISLSIPTAGVGAPDPNATTYRADNITIRLLVMIDEINGYLADGGYCNFEFEKYRSGGGAYYWRLTKWWDNTAAAGDANPGASGSSLGKILSLFR